MTIPTDPGSFPATPETFDIPFQFSQELPIGRWNLMINGRIYWLDIQRVDGDRVTAELSSGSVENATWNGIGTPLTAGKFSFIRVVNDLRQQLDGWLFQYSKDDPLWRMAGTIVHLDESKARSGWYGTLPRR